MIDCTRFNDWSGLRKALGLSLHQMAAMLCVSPSTYWRWEQHEHKPQLPAVMLLRIYLKDPALVARLKAARYPHPWPEDVAEKPELGPEVLKDLVLR